jgi:class 3 adenylate cyclase
MGADRKPNMPELPTATVTFLFTDIEGSTRLWEQQPAAIREALDLIRQSDSQSAARAGTARNRYLWSRG